MPPRPPNTYELQTLVILDLIQHYQANYLDYENLARYCYWRSYPYPPPGGEVLILQLTEELLGDMIFLKFMLNKYYIDFDYLPGYAADFARYIADDAWNMITTPYSKP